VFDEIHAPDILEELPQEKFKGFLEEASPDVPALPPTPSSHGVVAPPPATTFTAAPPAPQLVVEDPTPPPLETLISAADFEAVAKKTLTSKTWAFYSSAATDLITHGKNKELVRRIMIRPRILRDVSKIDFTTNILGFDSSAPFFISPAAMAKLVHPEGEIALSRAVTNENIIQCVRTQTLTLQTTEY
jgi:L-lactate dehydrogenase (cytochrome)